MTKNQSDSASIRQKQEMVKRVLAVAELLAKGSQEADVNPKTIHEASEKTRDIKPVVSS